MKNISFHIPLLLLFACNPAVKKSNLTDEHQEIKTVGNVTFSFPSDGYAYDHRDELMHKSLEAIKYNSTLIQLDQYTVPITVLFLRSRDEMKQHAGMTASGIAFPETKKVYIVANDDPKQVRPPIKHELMHLMSMTTWGYPGQDSNWMNEGLAAYVENDCNGYKVEQIYRYLSEKDMLIPLKDLTTSFYKQPEMIAYHQAAYIVQFLLNHYGVEKFKKLWQQGFEQFENIYGVAFGQVKSKIEQTAKQDYPTPPNINWNTFQKGCL